MATQTLNIDGMTCGGCARAVRAALSEVAGVLTVEADPDAGTAVVTTDREIPRDAYAAAVEEAGFTLK